jgi:hypothetical protein
MALAASAAMTPVGIAMRMKKFAKRFCRHDYAIIDRRSALVPNARASQRFEAP